VRKEGWTVTAVEEGGTPNRGVLCCGESNAKFKKKEFIEERQRRKRDLKNLEWYNKVVLYGGRMICKERDRPHSPGNQTF